MERVSRPDRSHGEPADWLERAAVLIWKSGLDGRREYSNETWLRFTGRRFDQELGDGWLASVHPEDLDQRVQSQADLSKRRTPYESEYRLRRQDGEYRWILERAVPIWEGNAFCGFVGAAIDVDERRQSRDTRDALLRMMTHELRTPLQALKMQLELLRRASAAGEVCTPERIEGLETQVDRFARLIDGLSQTGDRSRALLRRPLDLAALLRGVVEHRAHELGQAPGKCRHRLTYRGPEHAAIDADRGRLEQAFHNLLDNSVKFSPRGGEVEVDLESEQEMHRVTVRDRGVGIPQDEVPKVSRRFYRARNAPRQNFPGLGLGLAAARDIVEKHGGALSVASQVDRGTEVTVLLPTGRRGSA